MNISGNYKKYFKMRSLFLFAVISFALFGLVYSYLVSLGTSQIAAVVKYVSKSDTFIISQVYPSYNTANYLGLRPGDEITAIDGQSIHLFTKNSKYYLVNVDPLSDYPGNTFPKVFYSWPFPEDQDMLLLGAKATHISIKKASANSEQPAFELSLNGCVINENHTLLLTVQLTVGLLFWITGLVLFLFRPDEVLTLCFNCFFGYSAVYLVTNIAAPSEKNGLLAVLVIISSFLASAGFIYFSLLFPFGKLPTRKTSYLLLGLIVCGLVVNLFYAFYSFNKSPDFATLNLFRIWRLRLISIFVLLGIVFLVAHFFRSKGLERVKIKLAFASFLVATLIPLSVFTLYNVFGLFYDFAVNYFTFLCVPCLLFPIASLYSILKHNLFYSEFIIRQALYYLVLTALLSAMYFGCSLILSSIFYSVFAIGENAVGILTFLIIAVSASRLRTSAQGFIDRVFYRNKLDYTKLLKEWTEQLVQGSSGFTTLISFMTRKLCVEFHYERIALVLVDDTSKNSDMKFMGTGLSQSNFTALDRNELNDVPDAASYSSNSEVQLATLVKRVLLISYSQHLDESSVPQPANPLSNDVLLERLIDFDSLKKMQIALEVGEVLQLPDFLMKTDKDVIEDIRNFGQTDVSEYQFFVPFSAQCCVSGGLLFGNKLFGRVPSPEERNALVSITRQSTMALNSALKLQLEHSMRRLIQAFIVKRDSLKDEEQNKSARELHDGMGADIALVESRLGTWLLLMDKLETGAITWQNLSVKDPQNLIRQAYERSVVLKTHFRALLKQLRPTLMDFGLIVALKDYLLSTMELHPHIGFRFFPELTPVQEQLINASFSEENLRQIYRIVNEAVNNAINHSDGDIILVRLSWREEEPSVSKYLVVEVQDNGVGFKSGLQSETLVLSGHYGLVSMQERVELLRGSVQLLNQPSNTGEGSGGALVRAVFPVHQALEEVTASSEADKVLDEMISALLPSYSSLSPTVKAN